MLRSRSLEVLGYTNNAITPEQRLEAFTSVIRYAAEGRIRVAFETCPLQRADEAWARQASGTPTVGWSSRSELELHERLHLGKAYLILTP